MNTQATIMEFHRSLRLAALPATVVHEAKRAILDTLGCMVAGVGTPLGRGLSALGPRFLAGNGHGAVSLATPGRLEPMVAAMINGYLANAHDADDGHRRSRLHAGGVVIPAALAAAEEAGRDGAALLEAVVAGFEVGHRAGMASTAWDEYHGSSFGGAFGAAAAAAHLLGLDALGFFHALGIVEMHAPGCMLMGWIRSRHTPMVKEGMGWSAASGIMAAYLASQGIQGSLALFDDREALAEMATLGREYETLRRYYKPHPGCRWGHGALQLLRGLLERHHLSPGEIAEVVVRTNSRGVNLDQPAPHTMEDAQYSIPFMLAAGMVDGEFGPRQMEAAKLEDPAILAMSRRVRLEAVPEFDADYPARIRCQVEVRTQAGQRFQDQDPVTRGDEDNPLSDRDLEDKFDWITRDRLSAPRARDIRQRIWRLDRERDIIGLMSWLRDQVH